MSFLEDLHDVTRELVQQRMVFDKEGRKRYRQRYVLNCQSSSSAESTFNPNKRSSNDEHDQEPRFNEAKGTIAKHKISSNSKSTLVDNVESSSATCQSNQPTAGPSQGPKILRQKTASVTTLPSTIRLLTPQTGNSIVTLHEDLNAWLKKIAESNVDAIRIKRKKTGLKIAIANVDLQPGDYIVELRGVILGKRDGKQRIQDKFVKQRHLYTIGESANSYFVDTTYFRDWPGCYVTQSDENPNCGLVEVNIVGILKFVFVSLKSVNKGKLLTFCPKSTSEEN